MADKERERCKPRENPDRHEKIEELTNVLMGMMVEIAQTHNQCLPCCSASLGSKCLAALLVNENVFDRKTGEINAFRMEAAMDHFVSLVMDEARDLIRRQDRDTMH